MPEINQVQTLLPSTGQGTQIPWDLRQKMLAGQLAQQQAAAPTAPYTSRTAGLLKALQGGLGGLMEGAATQQVMQGQDEDRQHMAMLLGALKNGTALGSAPAAPGSGSAPSQPGVTPMGQGGAGSDAVAAGSARNPGGYDPKATEALIRARAPVFGIDPDAAVNVARHEGLNVYGGDKGSSFGPFQLHYGGVAGGGNAVGGMGDDFTKATGLDARDPSTVPQQIDFALSHAAKGGWGPWHGAQAAKMGNWDGIGGTATAAADAPAPNTRPVASDTLPPGVTPDMIGGAPASDGSVRSDLLAAAAQHGGLDPDAPAPNATPTGMAGLPPGVTPAMFAASQNTATDGNALHRNDEIPAGTPPYVPGSTPGPVTASGMPHQMAPGAAARADSGVGAGIGGGPSDTKPSPAADPSGYLDPEGTGADNYDPNAGPSLRDQLVAAMNKGPDLGTVQPAVVPPPTTAGAPPAPVAPSILPPPKPPSGLGTAAPAVVPPPQGDLTAPPEPQDAPSSDGSLRGDLLAAASAHGMDVAGSPIVPPPQGDLTAAPAGPAPDPVGAGLSAGQDVAMDPVVPAPQGSMMPPAPSSPNVDLDGPQSDAAMGNAAADAGPSLRDTIAAQFGNGAGTSGPQSNAAAPLAASGTDQSAGPAPIAALGATPDAPPSGPAPTLAGGPSGGPGASPGALPLPTMASAGTPGPTPMPPQPGTGAALPSTAPMPPPGAQSLAAGGPSLPQTGPMPPPGVQSLAAAGANPDAPAPNAVPAGPQPVSLQMLAALGGPQFGGSGTNAPSGNSAAVDPSSPQNFMRAEAARAAGNGPTPGGFFDSIAGAGTPARGQGAPGSGMLGMGGPVLGGPAQPSSPAQGGGGPIAGGAGRPPAAAPGGSAPATGSAPSSAGYQQGTSDQARALAQQIMTSRFATPQQQEFAMKVLTPQYSYQKLDNGDVLAINSLTNQSSVVAHGGKFAAARGVGVYNEGTGLGPNGQPVGGSTLLTPAEVQANGFPAGTHVQRAGNGELSVINPGPTADAANDFNKSLTSAYAEEPASMIKGVGAAQENLRSFNEMSGAIQRLQQNGGTTGMGAEEVKHLQSAINSGASLLGITQPFDLSDQEVIGKINRQVSSAAAKQMSTRGATNFDFAQLQQANPGLEMGPQGNVRMLGIMSQMEQRKIDLGTAYRDAVGNSMQNRTQLDPTIFDRIRTGYDADPSHHIKDPITGQDITANPRLPDVAPTPGQNGQPLPGGMANPRPMQGQAPAPVSQDGSPATSAAPQPQGQGGGYLPGAARGPVPAAPQGQGAPPPQQGGQPSQRPGAPAPADAIAQAQAAIAKGAPRAAVMQRLQSMGISTAGM